jgi:glutamate dehydrogenase (NAD) (EC 1.4.1.2)
VGGLPQININNWRTWLDEDGKPRFKVIVEGANLFLTQEARLRLEEKGVIIYKDASANKGGVTSSSLEVLASLGHDRQRMG